MIPVGYMYKAVCNRPDWLKSESVKDIYSVSGCISRDFDDWINDWKHNGYWFFDAAEIMQTIAKDKGIDLATMTLFFYRASEQQWEEDEALWEDYQPEKSFKTDVQLPIETEIVGYDLVSFSSHTTPECSPLSCNNLAKNVPVNAHCLLESYEEAIQFIQAGKLKNAEPGPYRIFEVHTVQG